MKIPNGIEDISQIFSSQAVTNATATKGNSSPQNETVEADKAQLSDLATQLAQSAAAPDVRMDKVASIQSALQAGTYQVSAEDVAQKIVTSMLAPEK
jgi:negative regulator of flagellin synthesis FlgM